MRDSDIRIGAIFQGVVAGAMFGLPLLHNLMVMWGW